ncbi:hypothetical protein, partial [Bacillus cereus]|uniref:hypothetical protein n=1 Tax=Bacillus cereus TaxID=1396 RepID=UPI0028528710
PRTSPLPVLDSLTNMWPAKEDEAKTSFSREELLANSKWILREETRIISWQGKDSDPASWDVDGVGKYLGLYKKLKLATS